MKTDIVSYKRLRITRYIGQIRDIDPLIQQEITSSRCYYTNSYCRPIESPFSVITWKYIAYKAKMFKTLGIYNVSRIHNYIVIPQLGFGGSIIKNQSNSWLLDIGYILEIQQEKIKKTSYNPKKENLHKKNLIFI